MAKRSFINMEDEDDEEEEEEEETESEYDDCGGDGDDRRKKVMVRLVCARPHQSQVQGMREPSAKMRLSSSTCCQADECGTNLRMEKVYHQKHKVCERHSKAPVVLVNGIRQRFCQQCSKFHEISEFDHMKRSCRQKLAGHNERRRKSQLDMQVESREKPHSSQTPLSF